MRGPVVVERVDGRFRRWDKRWCARIQLLPFKAWIVAYGKTRSGARRNLVRKIAR